MRTLQPRARCLSYVAWLSVLLVIAGGCGQGSHYKRALIDLQRTDDRQLAQRVTAASRLLDDAGPQYEQAAGYLIEAEDARASERLAAIDLARDSFDQCAWSAFELERALLSIQDVGAAWRRASADASTGAQYDALMASVGDTHRAMRVWLEIYERRLDVVEAGGDSPREAPVVLPTDEVLAALTQSTGLGTSLADALRNASN